MAAMLRCAPVVIAFQSKLALKFASSTLASERRTRASPARWFSPGSNEVRQELFSIMIALRLRVCLAVALLGVVSSTAADPPGSGWTLIWSDEFDGPNIDAGEWGWGPLPCGGNHHN